MGEVDWDPVGWLSGDFSNNVSGDYENNGRKRRRPRLGLVMVVCGQRERSQERWVGGGFSVMVAAQWWLGKVVRDRGDGGLALEGVGREDVRGGGSSIK